MSLNIVISGHTACPESGPGHLLPPGEKPYVRIAGSEDETGKKIGGSGIKVDTVVKGRKEQKILRVVNQGVDPAGSRIIRVLTAGEFEGIGGSVCALHIEHVERGGRQVVISVAGKEIADPLEIGCYLVWDLVAAAEQAEDRVGVTSHEDTVR